MTDTAQREVQRILNDACEKPDTLPGAVFAMMDRQGNYLAKATAGVRSLKTPDQKMTMDTAFAMFSCTKLITVIACLQIVEQGKIGLDEPIESVLPEVQEIRLLDGTVAKTKITLRMLLCHTAGFSYTFFNEGIRDWCAKNVPFDASFWKSFKQPLVAQPGEDWNYGASIDWAGAVLEKVTGMTLGQYCQKNIFEPLGIEHITFGRIPPGCEDKVTSMHSRGADGKVTPMDHLPSFINAEFHSGGGGAMATPEDYMKILYILINEGKGLTGAKILEPHSIEQMYQDQLPAKLSHRLDDTIPSAIPFVTHPVTPIPNTRKGWSFAGMLTKDALPSGRSANSVWWAGLGNLYWMADREKGVVNFIGSQSFPFYDKHTIDPYMAAEKAVYDSLGSQ